MKKESKSAQWKLGAAANSGSRKLVEGGVLWGRNRVKMASPLPFLKFLPNTHAKASYFFFFLAKAFAELCLFIVIFSLKIL